MSSVEHAPGEGLDVAIKALARAKVIVALPDVAVARDVLGLRIRRVRHKIVKLHHLLCL